MGTRREVVKLAPLIAHRHLNVMPAGPKPERADSALARDEVCAGELETG
jgi:hypothetical protein